MVEVLHVLLVEDDPTDAQLILLALREAGFDPHWQRVETEEAYLGALRDDLDVILADYSLPQFGAPQALALLEERHLDIPFIVVTGTVDELAVSESMQQGAADYLLKDRLTRLGQAVKRTLIAKSLRLDHRRAELALRDSELRYRQMFEGNHAVQLLIDPDSGKIVDANLAACDFYGYDRDTLTGMTFSAITALPQVAMERNFENVLKEKQTHLISRHRLASGAVHDVEVYASLIQIHDQNFLFAIIHDITERKRAEEALEQERLFAEALRDITLTRINSTHPDVVLQRILDNIGRVVPHDVGNITVVRDNKLQIILATGRLSPQTTIATNEITAEAPTLNHILQNGSAYLITDTQFESNWVDFLSNGLIRSYLGIPIRTYGQIIGSLNLGSAIPAFFTPAHAERLQAFADEAAIAIENAQVYEQLQHHARNLEQRVRDRTQELRAAKDHVENILNNSTDAIVLLDGDGIVWQSNPAFSSLFGYADMDVFRQPLTMLCEHQQMEMFQQTLSQVVSSRQPARIERVMHRKDGKTLSVDIALAPIQESPEGDLKIICSIRDISVQKRLEEELRNALEHEKELGEMKSRFVTMASHEFRTPLTTIMSSSGLMEVHLQRLLNEELPQPIIQHLRKIGISVRRMTDLLDDVLTIGKADAGLLTFRPEPVDLDGMCQDVVEELQMMSQNHTLRYSFSAKRGEIDADKDLLRRVLVNLLSNAIKYSPHGGEVHLDVVCDQDHATFRIQDTGIGIPAADQLHLFEAFQRASNVGSISGTGLGLAIAKRAIDAHHGTIKVESEVGKGTTFIVSIPNKL